MNYDLYSTASSASSIYSANSNNPPVPPPPGFSSLQHEHVAFVTWPPAPAYQSNALAAMRTRTSSKHPASLLTDGAGMRKIRPSVDVTQMFPSSGEHLFYPQRNYSVSSPVQRGTRQVRNDPRHNVASFSILAANTRPPPSPDPNHIKKVKRREAGEDTLSCFRRGFYVTDSGIKVDISNHHEASVKHTMCYGPDYYFFELTDARFSQMVVTVSTVILLQFYCLDVTLRNFCNCQVVGESTLTACKQLYREYGGSVGCLAFASAKNPGGGFMAGSDGQEESIARYL